MIPSIAITIALVALTFVFYSYKRKCISQIYIHVRFPVSIYLFYSILLFSTHPFNFTTLLYSLVQHEYNRAIANTRQECVFASFPFLAVFFISSTRFSTSLAIFLLIFNSFLPSKLPQLNIISHLLPLLIVSSPTFKVNLNSKSSCRKMQ